MTNGAMTLLKFSSDAHGIDDLIGVRRSNGFLASTRI
jgi:hypothetical protein